MSVVAGLVHNKKLYLAGDSLVSDDEGIVYEAKLAPKVFEWGDVLYGVVGDARVGDLIYAVFDPPEQGDDYESDYHYVVTEFVDALRETLKEGGVVLIGDNAAEWELLLGYRGTLYVIGPDFSVCVPARSYIAIGSGREPALGSLAATSTVGSKHTPEERVTKAVGAAVTRRSDCGGEVVYVSK